MTVGWWILWSLLAASMMSAVVCSLWTWTCFAGSMETVLLIVENFHSPWPPSLHVFRHKLCIVPSKCCFKCVMFRVMLVFLPYVASQRSSQACSDKKSKMHGWLFYWQRAQFGPVRLHSTPTLHVHRVIGGAACMHGARVAVVIRRRRRAEACATCVRRCADVRTT